MEKVYRIVPQCGMAVQQGHIPGLAGKKKDGGLMARRPEGGG
jgi:hypothetical protein